MNFDLDILYCGCFQTSNNVYGHDMFVFKEVSYEDSWTRSANTEDYKLWPAYIFLSRR